MQDYLKRRTLDKDYCARIVGSKVVQFAEMWDDKEFQSDVMNQMTGILIEHIESKENIEMTPREEYWYRKGLSELPTLWTGCIATKKNEEKKA